MLFKKAVVITGQHEMSLARKHESRPKAFEALLDFSTRSSFLVSLVSDVV